MLKLMPQEVEVWYLLPSLRKELTKVLIKDGGLSQKQTADLLGITESAVSQYLKSKRAKQIKFTKEEISEIRKVAHNILHDKKNTGKYFYELSTKMRGSESMCILHRKHD